MPFCFVCIIVHAFGYKRRGFAVINIDNISYWVVKNMILRFRPCWATLLGGQSVGCTLLGGQSMEVE